MHQVRRFCWLLRISIEISYVERPSLDLEGYDLSHSAWGTSLEFQLTHQILSLWTALITAPLAEGSNHYVIDLIMAIGKIKVWNYQIFQNSVSGSWWSGERSKPKRNSSRRTCSLCHCDIINNERKFEFPASENHSQNDKWRFSSWNLLPIQGLFAINVRHFCMFILFCIFTPPTRDSQHDDIHYLCTMQSRQGTSLSSPFPYKLLWHDKVEAWTLGLLTLWQSS